MSQKATDRLKDYLGQLPPTAQALLTREFERAISVGENVAVAQFVLGVLRNVAPPSPPIVIDDIAPLAPMDLAFQALRPFLADRVDRARPGRIARNALTNVWAWLMREGAPGQVATFEAALRASQDDASTADAIRQFDIAAAAAIGGAVAIANPGERQRALARIAPSDFADDLPAIAAVLRAADALTALDRRLPRAISTFEYSQVESASELLTAPGVKAPDVVPFALELVMQRLPAPWQAIRIALRLAHSDKESRVAATPYGVAVTMALSDLSRATDDIRAALKQGRVDALDDDLRAIHDGIRGLRTEIDLRSDSAWGKQLAGIRVAISDALHAQIDGVLGRVRRLLRQPTDKDKAAPATIDPHEVDEVAALIALVATCRNYAGELAISEVTQRTFSQLQQHVEQSIEALVKSLRLPGRGQELREAQARAAIRFCAILFGDEYAALMSRAIDNALTAARLDAAKAG